jgi:hypothetical protein
MTLYDLALRFVGLAELPGPKHNGFISWCHSLCSLSPDTPDEVPWCSSFLNGLAWILRLPRSKSAAARSWLEVGIPVPLEEARQGDIVIFKRGNGIQPGPEITRGAPGHVPVVVLGDLDPDSIEGRTIVDPWNSDESVFRSSYKRIDRCAEELAKILVKADPSRRSG